MVNFRFLILLLLTCNLFAQDILVTGTITDAETSLPIAFANIGVAGKDKGTVSDADGRFKISLTNAFAADSLTISHVSYHPIKVLVRKSAHSKILLSPNANTLREVVITTTKKRHAKIGVKSYNPLLWLAVTSGSDDIVEIAQRINIPPTPVLVKKVNLYLRAGFESDSSYIRINFYENNDDVPGEKILFENIIVKKNIVPGWLTIDLSDFDNYIDSDFFIGIEFLPDFKHPQKVYVGAILTKGKGYSRSSSEGTWKKLQGASTVNVEVAY